MQGKIKLGMTTMIMSLALFCSAQVKPNGFTSSRHLSRDSAAQKIQIMLPDSLSNANRIRALKNSLPGSDSNANDTGSWLSKIPIPEYQARISMEGFYTNFQNPRILSEPQYLRLSANASVNAFGIPLLMDAYRTTESQAIYNSNYFKIQFDYETYLEGIKKGWLEKYDKCTNQLNQDQVRSQQELKARQAIEKQQVELKARRENAANLLTSRVRSFSEKYNYNPDSIYRSKADSLRKIGQLGRDSFSHFSYNTQERFKDSMAIRHLIKDTQQIGKRMRGLQDKYEEYQNRRAHYDSLIAADSALLNRYRDLLANPKSSASAWLKENGFSKKWVLLSQLKDFQLGIVNPYIHPYSISGIGMKGISTTLSTARSEWNISAGKAIISDMNYYNRTNAKYERLFVGSYFKFHTNKNTEITLFSHHAQDPVKQFTAAGRTAFSNTNFGLNMTGIPKDIVKIDASFATSFFKSLNTAIQNISYPGSPAYSELDNIKTRSTYTIRAERSIGKSLNLEASDQFVGPGFKNLGNPFMRTNFREQKIKARLGLFREQIFLTTFYKSMRDNPLHFSEITNKTSGYGLSAQTRFKNKKLPNLNASISPYEQGNNHPDSLFRVNSRFSIITTGLTWRLNISHFKYYFMAYGSQSEMQFNDTFHAKVRTLSLNQDLAIGKYLTIGISTNFVRTYPSVDSTQVNIGQTRISWVSKKSCAIMFSAQYSQYLNGAFRKGVSLTSTVPIYGGYRLSVKGGYDHYYKLWGLEDQKALSVLGKLEIGLSSHKAKIPRK